MRRSPSEGLRERVPRVRGGRVEENVRVISVPGKIKDPFLQRYKGKEDRFCDTDTGLRGFLDPNTFYFGFRVRPPKTKDGGVSRLDEQSYSPSLSRFRRLLLYFE